MLFQFLRTITPTHDAAMLLSILGLLLAGAEPTSYGFLTHGNKPPQGDSSRGYATHVVHHANDFNNKTMHIHEVPLTCMEHPATRKHNMPELTLQPHPAQRDQVHPRGPANLRDVNQNTTGSDYTASATCTSSATNPERAIDAACTSHAEHAANATCTSDANYPKCEKLGLWWAFQQVAQEYQYFMRKPSSPPKSRRRRRYEERVSWLSGRGGRVKKRRKLGPPGAETHGIPKTQQQAPESPLATVLKWVIISYVPCLVFITTALYLDMLATHACMQTGVTQSIQSTTLAFLASCLILLFAAHWLCTLVTLMWTMPGFAAALTCMLNPLLIWIKSHVTSYCHIVHFLLQCIWYGPARIHTLVLTTEDGTTYLLNVQLSRETNLWTNLWTAARRCLHNALLFAANLAVAAVSPSIALPAACRASRRLLQYTWLVAQYACRWFGLGRMPLARVGGGLGPGASWFILVIGLLHYTAGMEGEQAQGTKVKPPMFSGERTDYTQWMIQFTVWVALYLQECASLLEGDDPEPATEASVLAENPATPEHALAVTRATHVRWTARNRKLFGAIAMAMPRWLMQSLYTSCRNSGMAARLYMRNNFSAVAGNGNDRAAAVTRLQRSHIDAKADLNEQNVRTQYDSMMIAVADLQAAGAAPPDEPMLISMFENALPASYTVIRQMVRRQNHGTLLAYYTDVLREVRAELQSRAPTAHAFPAAAHAFAAAADGTSPGPASSDANVAALVAALQAMGYNRPNGRPAGDKRPREPYPSEPCLICTKEGHKRENCKKAATAAPCRFCGKKGHAAPYCPHNPTAGGKRRALAPSLRALVDREAGPTPLPNPGAPGTSASHAPSTYAAAAAAQHLTEEQAQAHAAAAAAQHADPSAMASAYSAALRACGYGLCATVTTALAAAAPPVRTVTLPPAASASTPDSCNVVPIFVDTMATYFVVSDPAYLVRITDANPTIGITTADGVKPVVAIGVAHMWVPDTMGVWLCYEVPNVLLLPKCGQCLYSQRVMRDLFNFRHDFDVALDIKMPRRPALPMHDSGASFEIMVAFSTTAVPADRRVTPTGHVTALVAVPADRRVTPTGHVTALVACALAAGPVGTPQSLLFQRLAYPHARAWRHISASTRGHNLPPGVVMNGSLPVREAVMRGRARALPFFATAPQDRTPPPPGAVIYMDFAGPVAPSFPHGLTTYCGAIDAGSLYGRIMAAHTMTRDIATQTLSLILADIAAKMKSAVPLKPFVVNCDNGSAFISKHFREFLADRQIALRFSPPYTPQLNAQIESMWWIENRLPKPTRGNQTPAFMLSKQLPNLSHLYTFGCLCLVTLPGPLREGDAHFMDRGAPDLYLGPSEEGQCHIVYVFALRRVLPTAKLRVWEDQFPGLRGHRYAWFPTLPAAGSEGPVPPAVHSTPSNNNIEPPPDSNNNNAQPPLAEPASSPSPPSNASSPQPLAYPPPPADTPFPFDAATEFDSPAATASSNPATSTETHPTAGNTTRLPKTDSGNSADPQSRSFNRVMPSRSSRNSNPNYASLAGLAALYASGSAFNRLNAMIAHSLASPTLATAVTVTRLASPTLATAVTVTRRASVRSGLLLLPPSELLVMTVHHAHATGTPDEQRDACGALRVVIPAAHKSEGPAKMAPQVLTSTIEGEATCDYGQFASLLLLSVARLCRAGAPNERFGEWRVSMDAIARLWATCLEVISQRSDAELATLRLDHTATSSHGQRGEFTLALRALRGFATPLQLAAFDISDADYERIDAGSGVVQSGALAMPAWFKDLAELYCSGRHHWSGRSFAEEACGAVARATLEVGDIEGLASAFAELQRPFTRAEGDEAHPHDDRSAVDDATKAINTMRRRNDTPFKSWTSPSLSRLSKRRATPSSARTAAARHPRRAPPAAAPGPMRYDRALPGGAGCSTDPFVPHGKYEYGADLQD